MKERKELEGMLVSLDKFIIVMIIISVLCFAGVVAIEVYWDSPQITLECDSKPSIRADQPNN